MTIEHIPSPDQMQPPEALALLTPYTSRFELSGIDVPSVPEFEEMKELRGRMVEPVPDSGQFILHIPNEGSDPADVTVFPRLSDSSEVVRSFLELSDPDSYRLTQDVKEAMGWFVDTSDPLHEPLPVLLLHSAGELDAIESLQEAFKRYVADHPELAAQDVLANFQRHLQARVDLAEHVEAQYPQVQAVSDWEQPAKRQRYFGRTAGGRRGRAERRDSALLPPETQGRELGAARPITAEEASRDPQTAALQLPGASHDSGNEYADDPHWESDDRQPWLMPKIKAANSWLGLQILKGSADVYAISRGRSENGRAALMLGGIATAVADRYLHLGLGEFVGDQIQGASDFIGSLDDVTPRDIPLPQTDGSSPVGAPEQPPVAPVAPEVPEIGQADGTDSTDTPAPAEQLIRPVLDRPGEGVTAAIAEELGWDRNNLSGDQARLLSEYTDQAYAQNQDILGSRADERSHAFGTEFELTVNAQQTDAGATTQPESSEAGSSSHEVTLRSGGVDTISEATVIQFRNAGVSLPPGSSYDIALRVADYNGIDHASLSSLPDGKVIRYPSVDVMRQWVMEWEQSRQNREAR